jgi:hypothetical protein
MQFPVAQKSQARHPTFVEQLTVDSYGTLALQESYHPGNAKLRWNGEAHVNMICHRMTFQAPMDQGGVYTMALYHGTLKANRVTRPEAVVLVS